MSKCIICGGKITMQCKCSRNEHYCKNGHVYHYGKNGEIHNGESNHNYDDICCENPKVLKKLEE